MDGTGQHRPAHETKSEKILKYSGYSLRQSDDGTTNGTTLWLGGQILSAYLPTLKTRPGKAIELGAGIGLSALTLASLGWDVVATDLQNVIDLVLSQNASANAHLVAGNISVRELDWTVQPEHWSWTDTKSVSARSPAKDPPAAHPLGPPFDLIVTSDTLYTPQLAQPLLRTIYTLASLSHAGGKSPLILLCFERRDPLLIDHTLNDAYQVWGLKPERIPNKKLVQAMEKAGLRWNKEDWDGVELWKLKLEKPSKGASETAASSTEHVAVR
ncbi:hypothetical protein BJ322DRAFT_996726 [Thelephora terrestris]|uniref:Uncharacterized protein n=1 Tax=Thelephora terrestris TaxID=56493 RepID=A0A9P6LCQ9_9AGAM|nr:hypothetical protein BJ322DRAFT_996726 [Thelephora terrestris]